MSDTQAMDPPQMVSVKSHHPDSPLGYLHRSLVDESNKSDTRHQEYSEKWNNQVTLCSMAHVQKRKKPDLLLFLLCLTCFFRGSIWFYFVFIVTAD
jgi:hypothetical protein